MKGLRRRASILAVAIAASAGGLAMGNTVSATDYSATVNRSCPNSHSERLVGSSWQYKGQVTNCLDRVWAYFRMDIADGPDSSNKYIGTYATASWDWFYGGSGGFRQWKACSGSPCG